jgi:glutamate dehydrogenase
MRLMAAAGCDVRAFAAGYEAAKAVLDFETLWAAADALDGKVPAAGQMALYRRLAAALRGATFWLARRAAREGLDVAALTGRYAPGFKRLKELMPGVASQVEQDAIAARTRQLAEAGAPEEAAQAAAVLQSVTTAADLVDLAAASSWPLPNVARLYHQVGAAFAFDRLRSAAAGFSVGDSFERTALRRLLEDLLAEQAALTRTVMAFAGSDQAGADAGRARAAVADWAQGRDDKAEAARRTIEEIDQAAGAWTFAKLTIANAALRELVESGAGRRK